jgi:hypothetical protein
LWTSDQLVAEAAIYTAHNKQNRRTSVSSAGFETAIKTNKQVETYALDSTATGPELVTSKISITVRDKIITQ